MRRKKRQIKMFIKTLKLNVPKKYWGCYVAVKSPQDNKILSSMRVKDFEDEKIFIERFDKFIERARKKILGEEPLFFYVPKKNLRQILKINPDAAREIRRQIHQMLKI